MKNMTLFDNTLLLSTVMDTSTYVEETIHVLKNGMPFELNTFIFNFFPSFISFMATTTTIIIIILPTPNF